MADVDRLVEIEITTFDSKKYPIIQKKQFQYLITKGKSEVWLAEESGCIFGYMILLFRENSSIGRLYSIAVDPLFQGGDIGRRLFVFAEKRVKENSRKYLSQEIRSDHIKLLNRYTQLGYRHFGILRNYYPDNGDGIKLVKEL